MTAGPWGDPSLQTDPIGQEDDPNLYAYVKGDPVDRTDPTGTIVVADDIVIAAAIGAVLTAEAADHYINHTEAGQQLKDNASRIADRVGEGINRSAQHIGNGIRDLINEARGPKTQPIPGAEGPHSVPRPPPGEGDTRGYTTYRPNSQNPTGHDEEKRVDVTGKPHTNPDGTRVPTPHVHEGDKPVRPARPDELPKPSSTPPKQP